MVAFTQAEGLEVALHLGRRLEFRTVLQVRIDQQVVHAVLGIFAAAAIYSTTGTMSTYTCIETYVPAPGVGAIKLNRPQVLNALSLQTMIELVGAFETYDADPEIRCIVLHGNEKAFAAGADITEMSDATAVNMLERDQFTRWERIRQTKTPVIAAVSGFALGGGCELAMLCDMIVASDTAQFGQPEINIGVMPGAGGTQRMTRAVGKALAMEIVLTGRAISAQRALQAGLVNRIAPVSVYLEEAIALAKEVASKAPVAARLAKESVLKAFSSTLEGGLEFERKNFYLLFATEDQKEGMSAFVEKRKAQWKGR
jgi:enoyl-CoA hydratase